MSLRPLRLAAALPPAPGLAAAAPAVGWVSASGGGLAGLARSRFAVLARHRRSAPGPSRGPPADRRPLGTGARGRRAGAGGADACPLALPRRPAALLRAAALFPGRAIPEPWRRASCGCTSTRPASSGAPRSRSPAGRSSPCCGPAADCRGLDSSPARPRLPRRRGHPRRRRLDALGRSALYLHRLRRPTSPSRSSSPRSPGRRCCRAGGAPAGRTGDISAADHGRGARRLSTSASAVPRRLVRQPAGQGRLVPAPRRGPPGPGSTLAVDPAWRDPAVRWPLLPPGPAQPARAALGRRLGALAGSCYAYRLAARARLRAGRGCWRACSRWRPLAAHGLASPRARWPRPATPPAWEAARAA